MPSVRLETPRGSSLSNKISHETELETTTFKMSGRAMKFLYIFLLTLVIFYFFCKIVSFICEYFGIEVIVTRRHALPLPTEASSGQERGSGSRSSESRSRGEASESEDQPTEQTTTHNINNVSATSTTTSDGKVTITLTTEREK